MCVCDLEACRPRGNIHSKSGKTHILVPLPKAPIYLMAIVFPRRRVTRNGFPALLPSAHVRTRARPKCSFRECITRKTAASPPPSRQAVFALSSARQASAPGSLDVAPPPRYPSYTAASPQLPDRTCRLELLMASTVTRHATPPSLLDKVLKNWFQVAAVYLTPGGGDLVLCIRSKKLFFWRHASRPQGPLTSTLLPVKLE